MAQDGVREELASPPYEEAYGARQSLPKNLQRVAHSC